VIAELPHRSWLLTSQHIDLVLQKQLDMEPVLEGVT
jgi:hypothetical protein